MNKIRKVDFDFMKKYDLVKLLPSTNIAFTWSPLMNHCRFAAGLEVPDVQFTFTSSPMWYLGFPPLIRGPSSGSAKIKIENY